MATDKMIGETDGPIGRLIFNQPEKHNAVTLDMWRAGADILDAFAEDDAVRVVVLAGAGKKAFVSGADISKFEDERASRDGVIAYNQVVERFGGTLSGLDKPTIAMIRGYCMGGGVGLAVGCDLRFCSENARFGVPAAKLGVGYGHVGVKRLADLVGPAFTKEIFFTARQFDAEEARVMGLVNRVVPDDDLEDYVAEQALRIAANAPLTIRALKRTVGELVKDAGERDLAASEALVEACFDSQDYVEGRRAFMEKRKPDFSGR